MKRHSNLIVTTGIPSLFLIFSVLVVVILSLLTLNTSRSDAQASQLSLEQTQSYYEACGDATDFCTAAREFLADAAENAENSADYYTQTEDWFSGKDGVTWDADTRQATYETAFSDAQVLSVTVQVSYPEEASACLKLLSWHTVSTKTWQSQETQPVYRSGSN